MRVGRYEIIAPLGRGGMAVVHRARQLDLGREVALKELALPVGLPDDTLSARFARESRLAGAISHPNVVTVLEYLEVPVAGQPPRRFIAMELVPGGALRAAMHPTRPFDMARLGGVLEGVLGALDAAGSVGIVHRDLKPENIMVTADGQVKVSDFGVATAIDAALRGVSLTPVGSVHGTPAYMAPEQATGLEVTHATDLYAAGCLAYELLTGRPPFGDMESPMTLMLRHVNDPPVWLLHRRPDLHPGVSEWVHHLLNKDPLQRPESARAAWETLEELMVEELGPLWRRAARVQPPPPAAPARPPSVQAVIAEPAAPSETPVPAWRPADDVPAGAPPAPPVPLPQPSGGSDPPGHTWYELALMLEQSGDTKGALVALRRAARRGHPAAAARLAALEGG